MKGKNIYDYIRGHLPIPQKILTRLEPYFEKDFQAEMVEDGNKIAVIYSFFKEKNLSQPSPSKISRRNLREINFYAKNVLGKNKKIRIG